MLNNCHLYIFNSSVCVSRCSRQRDIHGTSISSLMYCKYCLFCAAYININIRISEYPTHRQTRTLVPATQDRDLTWLQRLDISKLPRDDFTKKVLHFASGDQLSDCQDRGLDQGVVLITRVLSCKG